MSRLVMKFGGTSVANVERIRATLPWRSQFQDLDTIVAHALAWEKRLHGKRGPAPG